MCVYCTLPSRYCDVRPVTLQSHNKHGQGDRLLEMKALAEFEEEVLEEGYDEDDEEPEDDEDGDGGEMEPAVDESLNSAAGIDRLGSVILSVALPLAAQGSLHRQMYVSQQQRPPLTMTPTQPQQPQQQAPAAGCSPPNHIGHVPYEPQYSNEPSLSSIPSPTKDGLVRPTSETSYPSSTSGEGSGCLESAAGPASGPVPAFPAVQEANGSLAAAAASAGVGGGGGKGGARGGGGAGAPIWRRRNAFVEWANTMHHEMVVEEQPPGGSSASGGGGGGSGSGNGSGSGVPGGGMPGHGNTMAGGAGGTEHTSSSSGYAVPLALAADTLPPEGVQFQYAPGVYITLKPPAQKGGPVRLVKVRFNRKMFTEQSQGQAWWNMHRATLAEMYELTFDMGNKAPVAPSSSPPGLPPLAPGSHGTVPPAAMHTRGMSTDTQGTSAGSTAASGSSSMYFSVPVSNSPLHGGAASGAAGGGDLVTGSAGAMWRSVASAVAGGGGGGGGAGGGGGDFDMSWTELNYDSQAMMVLPPPPPVGTMGVAGSPAMPQRRDHSRNSSRTASGGSSHAGVSRPPSQPCPESPVFAVQQFGSGESGSASGVGVGGDGGGGGGGPLYPATATALATTAAAAAAQPYYPSHQRAQSGGGSSGRS
ncbi:hypothetical protein VOLCADRAFT_108567 [Volvox carteri f. nagariensis]|uniref:BRX domain-containing protein n=1 Tax=Volvox carteri f. nagariensis TaxID=3068 RepID=D8UKZ9_VOLCA|nr:uncharacterized protein VOLCADRAFT_108567 [Volvox carteri f. nagariensis]EFJ39600.1 hypothetical protein VOLCADRAFT_108567 [Volvox carteri f. nagariensis]|eukprot:XP_002959332.1 hypothetical protein VOLCADRAFT_108567 [Volvox carteri f. nagariensis]